MPKFTQQIVVFLDILGFSNMIGQFEEEALSNDTPGVDLFHESEELNKLIKIFTDIAGYIKQVEFSYYLFSDNICFAISYIDNETEYPEAFEDVIIAIGELQYKFAQEGYFLRGGIDAGWFLDSADVAIGKPLVNAYLLEKDIAIHPRVMISDGFKLLLDDYLEKNKLTDYASFLSANYVKPENDKHYFSPFFYITNFEEKSSKIEYLLIYSNKVKAKLAEFVEEGRVRDKYLWFAKEFNTFIDQYLNENGYKELDNSDLEYTEEELKTLISVKIDLK